MAYMKCENLPCGFESGSSTYIIYACVCLMFISVFVKHYQYLNCNICCIQTEYFDDLEGIFEQATQANEGVTFTLEVEDVMVVGGKTLRTVPLRYVEVTTAQVEVDPTDPISTPLLNTPIGAGANFCPRCGNPCSGDAFCSSCGNKLS
eukprot:TRINITY_DN3369_c0_g1_i1.p1 TRINITY_DN3369_c0_g1~~TRINITY_DN3369_c0_g1_i1.p1  ORF type:complete len:148 (-),score=18.42 TRINITY_DN3369_c0_g1_i1:39-482(-)